jgi:hypothetical protein
MILAAPNSIQVAQYVWKGDKALGICASHLRQPQSATESATDSENFHCRPVLLGWNLNITAMTSQNLHVCVVRSEGSGAIQV